MQTKPSFEHFVSQYASDEWLLLIKNYLSFKSFKQGSRIFNDGDIVTGVYFINLGKVKITSRYNLENERILRLSKKGELLGHRAFHSSTFPVSAIALTDVELTFIPKDIFVKFVKANPDFSLYLLEFMSKDLHDTEERMKSMIHHEVIVRIGKIICMLIEAYGYDFKIPNKLHYTLSQGNRI
jgi:CRP-like cAMP-binding protein